MKRYLFVSGWVATVLVVLMAIIVYHADGAVGGWLQSTPTLADTDVPDFTPTPGPIDGFIARLFLNGIYQDFVCYPAGMEPTPTWETTATPLPTALPPSPVPTDTPTITPSPTPTVTPSPTLTPLPLCTGTTTANLNVRSGPGTGYKNIEYPPGTKVVWPAGQTFPVNGWAKDSNNGVWLKTVHYDLVGWVSAAYVTLSAECATEFPTMPRALNLNTAVGIRTVPGASGFEAIYPILKSKGIPYGVSPYDSLSYCVSALQQGGLCVWRPGAPDCPSGVGVDDPADSARAFMGHAAGGAYILRGAKGAYIEATNECSQTPMSDALMIWWRDFFIEYTNQAYAQGWPPLALPGFSPGNGDQRLFDLWKPMFENLRDKGGVMSTHAYTFQSQTGLCVYDQWEAARHVLQHKYMLTAGYEIPIVISEAARQSGAAPVDVDDMVCWVNKARQEDYILAVFLWVGGHHPTWAAANLDGHYTEIAQMVQ